MWKRVTSRKRPKRSDRVRRARHETLEDRRLLVATVSVMAETPVVVPEDSREEIVYTFARDETDDYLSVKFELTGTAEYDVDYVADEADSDTIWLPDDAPASGPVEGTAVFFPGESTVQMVVTPRNDLISELNENVTVTVVGADEFGPTSGAAALIVNRQDTVYLLADDENQLATVDIETGCVHVLGTMDIPLPVSDIAINEEGIVFAITASTLYQVHPESASAGNIPATLIGSHGVGGANALVDARDGDFNSDDGDLLVAGTSSLDLFRIDLEVVDDVMEIDATVFVFDIDGTLAGQAMPSNYHSSGDLDYFNSGDLVLSARGFGESFDSLIEIETPGNGGVISNAPTPAQDPSEDFVNLYGLAFDGNDSYAFAGHTMLSVNQFNRDSSRELEMTGRPYLIGTPSVATGVILGDLVKQDTVGLYQPDLSLFHLKESFTPGAADQYFAFGPTGSAGWVPLTGDWDGDGTDTIGLYQPDIGLFHLKDSFTPGAADQFFAFGPSGNAGWIPLAGDWNGDGTDTIGLYQPDISLFHLKDSFTAGASDQYFAFGPSGNAGWTPLAGDWNGDGTDTIGLYQPDISLFHLKDSFTPGASDQYFAFGPGGSAGWVPVVGDWDGNATDTVGLYQPDLSLFHLKNSFTPGASDQYFAFGPGGSAGWIPLAGDWNGPQAGSPFSPFVGALQLEGSGESEQAGKSSSVDNEAFPASDDLFATKMRTVSLDILEGESDLDVQTLQADTDNDADDPESKATLNLLDDALADWV